MSFAMTTPRPEKTANLIDEPDAINDRATVYPMNRLCRWPFSGVAGHEAHGWSIGRLADGVRVR